MTATAVYSYRPAYNQYICICYNFICPVKYFSFIPKYISFHRFVADVRIVHFIGSTKPWQVADGSSFQTSVPSEHVDLWWKIYREHVRPCLSANMVNDSPGASRIWHLEPKCADCLPQLRRSYSVGHKNSVWMEEEPQSPLSSETDAEEQRNSNNRHELEAMVDIQPITLSTLAQVMPMAFDWL